MFIRRRKIVTMMVMKNVSVCGECDNTNDDNDDGGNVRMMMMMMISC